MTLGTKKLVPFFVALVLVATALVPVSATTAGTIVDVVMEINAETGEFSTLIAALDAADPAVLEVLAGWGQRTVFAPTDAAFAAAFEELEITPEELLADQATLNKILLYHVTWGRFYAEDVLAKDRILMLWGGWLQQAEGVLTDNLGREATIIQTDVEADNGIIHVIDNVVLPRAIVTRTIVDVVMEINAETGEFSTLIAALQAAHPLVLEMLAGPGQRTVFAPTDAAFAATLDELGMTAEELLADQATLTRILLYHMTWGRLYAEDVLAKDRILMLWGGWLQQDGGVLTDRLGREATIIQTDVEADNGIIHVIDNVVLSRRIITRTIVDVVTEINAETGEFTTLLAALEAAHPKVLELLSFGGQRTVFAPTDAAFAATLDELGMTAEELLADQATLTRILLYHMTWGRLYAEDVLAKDRILMLWGGWLRQDGGVLTDNLGREATIIQTDVEADNGIIHVIDNVVLPK